MSEQTLRTEMLLGSDALARLRRSRVAVLGLGGVGSWCAEALARAGHRQREQPQPPMLRAALHDRPAKGGGDGSARARY